MRFKIRISMASLLIVGGFATFLALKPQARSGSEAGQDFDRHPQLQPIWKKSRELFNALGERKTDTSGSRYWEQVPNTSESFGRNIEESGPRRFLNHSQTILGKALKGAADMEQLKALFANQDNYQAILDHYSQLPDTFHFVEEATRIKMLNFLIASMELGGEWQDRALPVMRRIAGMNVKEIADPGLAQSVAGDVIRILAAISKYDKAAYDDLKRELETRSINSKVIAYFEEQKSGGMPL